MMEWILEHIHVFAGTPWWASIAITAVAVRLVMLKGYMGASDVSARMSAVKHIVDPLRTEMTKSTGNLDKTLELRTKIQTVHSRAGVKPWKAFIPMLQVFTGYGTWVLLRGMSELPVPGFEDGGFLWVYNLAVPDPLYILPLGTAALLHWTLRVRLPLNAS